MTCLSIRGGCVFAALTLFSLVLHAQNTREVERKGERKRPPVPAVNDSTQPGAVSDSAHLSVRKDSVRILDSLRVRFIPGLGAFLPPDSNADFTSRRFLFMDEKSPDELLWRIPGFSLRDLGNPGQPSQAAAFGSDVRSIPVFLDGRPMNDPVTGAVNISDIPLEYVGRLEVISGAEAIRSGLLGPAAALNFVSRPYNSLTPVTTIRFVQDPKETILTDLLFTQNILRGINLHLGILRQTSQGLFRNSVLDSWNLRARLRYNISDRINVAVADIYNRTAYGLNGGVDEFQGGVDPFDNVAAVVHSLNAYQIQTRNDLSLTGIARFLPDSASTTHLTLYTTSVEREFTLGQIAYDASQNYSFAVRTDRLSSFVEVRMSGLRAEQRFIAAPLSLSGFVEKDARSMDATVVLPQHAEVHEGIGVSVSMDLGIGSLSASTRHDELRDEGATSLGGAVVLRPIPQVRIDADWSRGVRFPTIQEVYWKDSLLVRRGTIGAETPTMLHIGVTIDAGDWLTLQAGIFRRDVDHALLFVQDSTAFGTSATGLYAARTQRTDGVTVAATLRWGPFALTGTAAYLHTTVDEAEKLLVPQYSFGTEATYQNRFFGGALDIKLGSRLRFTDRFHGTTFVPSAQIFPEDTKYLLGRTTALDAFLVFRIGDAHVSLAMDNILNANQLDVIFYPLPKRHIRLGVNWSFFN